MSGAAESLAPANLWCPCRERADAVIDIHELNDIGLHIESSLPPEPVHFMIFHIHSGKFDVAAGTNGLRGNVVILDVDCGPDVRG